MWPRDPRPAEASRSAGPAPPPAEPSAPAPRPPAPPAPAALDGKRRPFGFAVLSALLGIGTALGAAVLMEGGRPPGVPGAVTRLMDVLVLASGGVLAMGLWRCERWVGRVATVWGALYVTQIALAMHPYFAETPGLGSSPGFWIVALAWTALLGAVVRYVRRRNRDLWPTP
jgi:hypothetical protein